MLKKLKYLILQKRISKFNSRKVKGETTWSLGSNENGNFIRAEAEGVGSRLGKR